MRVSGAFPGLLSVQSLIRGSEAEAGTQLAQHSPLQPQLPLAEAEGGYRMPQGFLAHGRPMRDLGGRE